MYGYGSFRPYVSVGERRKKAEKAAAKMAKKGEKVSPVRIEGRTIAKTFWGEAWCDHLESFSDYENRLPRGRTYVRNGSVSTSALKKAKSKRSSRVPLFTRSKLESNASRARNGARSWTTAQGKLTRWSSFSKESSPRA